MESADVFHYDQGNESVLLSMKMVSKKRVKRFIRTYNDILTILCEMYNLGDEKASKGIGEYKWEVGDLDPELADINNLHITVPVDGKFSAVRLMKDNNGAMYELVKVQPETLSSKKARKKLLKARKKLLKKLGQ